MLTSNSLNYALAFFDLLPDGDWAISWGALDAPSILCAGATYQYPIGQSLVSLPVTYIRPGQWSEYVPC